MDNVYYYQPNTAIRFELDDAHEFVTENSGQPDSARRMTTPVKPEKAWMAEKWLVACMDRSVSVLETRNGNGQARLLITGVQSGKNARMLYVVNGTENSVPLSGKFSVEIFSGETGIIKLTTPDAVSGSEAPPTAAHTPSAGGGQPSATEQRLRTDLNEALSIIAQLKNALNLRIEQLTEETQQELIALSESSHAYFNRLNEIRSDRETLQQKNAAAEDQIRTEAEQLNEIKERLGQKQEQLSDLQAQRASLQEELDTLESQEEFLTLDSQEAQRRINGLRTQVNLDADTLAILEDDHILTRGCVSSTLEEVQEKLDAAEKRIALIIRFRTTYNASVDHAILSGDGSISYEDETGGVSSGDGAAATEPDETASE